MPNVPPPRRQVICQVRCCGDSSKRMVTECSSLEAVPHEQLPREYISRLLPYHGNMEGLALRGLGEAA